VLCIFEQPLGVAFHSRKLSNFKENQMRLPRTLKNQSGQGMTEYIIIVALIAVAAIAVFTYFGSTVRHQTAAITKEIAGESGADEVGKASGSAGQAVDAAAGHEGLKEYTGAGQ